MTLHKRLTKLGLVSLTSLLLVACATDTEEVDNNTGVEADDSSAEVVVEDLEDGLEQQTETWTEVDEETGEEVEVTVVKHVENGEVIRSSESRIPVNAPEDSEEQSEETSEEGGGSLANIEDTEYVDEAGETVTESVITIETYDENGELISSEEVSADDSTVEAETEEESE